MGWNDCYIVPVSLSIETRLSSKELVAPGLLDSWVLTLIRMRIGFSQDIDDDVSLAVQHFDHVNVQEER
jgi:hypothetical protein